MANTADSQIQILAKGLVMGESPRWHEDRLWVSDWGAQQLLAFDMQGEKEVIADIQAFPFCIDWLPDGRLLVVAGSKGLLLRREPNGSFTTHADLRELSRFPWNEIVVDGRGNIYVNNICFDFPGGEFAPGIIALVSPDGSVKQVADGVAFPNGMAITPDNSTLILGESYGQRLTAFDIAADGSLSNRRVWAETKGDHPDGICIDSEGAVWYADVGNARCVRVREGGEILQSIDLDRGCFSCTLGGENGDTLFMVAAEWHGAPNAADSTPTGQVLTAKAPAPAAGW